MSSSITKMLSDSTLQLMFFLRKLIKLLLFSAFGLMSTILKNTLKVDEVVPKLRSKMMWIGTEFISSIEQFWIMCWEIHFSLSIALILMSFWFWLVNSWALFWRLLLQIYFSNFLFVITFPFLGQMILFSKSKWV
jgi:hypothetical protein